MYGVYLTGNTDSSIIGAGINNNGTATNNTYDQVYVTDGSCDFTISNNNISWYNGSNKPRWGVYLQHVSGTSARYVITNNRCTGNNSGSVSDNGTGTPKTVSGNI
jgi:hypothetical protein